MEPSLVGRPAPPFTLVESNGRPFRLADQRGKVCVFVFASGADPVGNATAEFYQKMYDRYQGPNASVFIVQVSPDSARVREWVRRLKLTVPVLIDGDGKVAASFAPPEVAPQLPRDKVTLGAKLVLDGEGKIRIMALRGAKWLDAEMLERIDGLLGPEAPARPAAHLKREAELSNAVVSVHVPGQLAVPSGRAVQTLVSLRVAEGYRIQANPASLDSLVPLRLELDAPAGLRISPPVYPESRPFRLVGWSRDVATYEETVQVKLTIEATPTATAGEQVVKGAIRYQACTASKMLPPEFVPFKLTVKVLPAAGTGPGR